VLEDPAAHIVLAIVVLSMLLAPIVVWYNGRVARRLVPGYQQRAASNVSAIQDHAAEHAQHVIICGYGRSGQNLAWMLEQEGMSSLALDLDPQRVRAARDAGKPVVYGDAARRDVLHAVGLERAQALAISFNDAAVAFKILEITRSLRPTMPVIVRTMDDTDLERLMQAGATEVVPESLEGSLMMGAHMLLLLGAPAARVDGHLRAVRRNRYRMLRGFFRRRETLGDPPREPSRERLHSVTLPANAYAVNRELRELGLDTLGVSVNAVRHEGKHSNAPAPDTRFAVGDVLVLYGTQEALEDAERVLLEGYR
jgi:CPA2 family monovalent cation:H+ antiporter-2